MRSIKLAVFVTLRTILPSMTALAQDSIESGQILHLQEQVIDTGGAAITEALYAANFLADES